MKKGRKHINISALLAILVLSTQTAFFPLHYYFTHHNAILHYSTGQVENSRINTSEQPLSTTVEDEGCFWCDLFAHQGYFMEKISEFEFFTSEIPLFQPFTLIHTLLKPDFPVSRGPPACKII